MAHEDQKDFNAMLRRDSGMPRIQVVTDEATIRKYGGSRMYFATPLDYDRAMRTVPPAPTCWRLPTPRSWRRKRAMTSP